MALVISSNYLEELKILRACLVEILLKPKRFKLNEEKIHYKTLEGMKANDQSFENLFHIVCYAHVRGAFTIPLTFCDQFLINQTSIIYDQPKKKPWPQYRWT